MALTDVALLVIDGTGVFGVGVACEVFGYDRSAEGLPRYRFDVVSETPGPVRTDTGLTILADHGLDRLQTADLIIVTGCDDSPTSAPAAVVAALQQAAARGALIMSHCTGAFVLAATGLLDGKRATTHWLHADQLAAAYPKISVDRTVLFVDNGQIITGAGTASGIDLSLYVIRREQGARVANAIARRMVVPAQRDGGQAQYVSTPLPEVVGREGLGRVLDWAQAHLDQALSVDLLADRAAMSPRSFARHFRAATGTTPAAWILARRLDRAEQLLEGTDLPVELVAEQAGFGSAVSLREHFSRRRGVSPRAYRRTFRAAA